MNTIQQGVLILYNAPRPDSPAGGAFRESESGVLREVQAVAEALLARHIPHREAGVADLAEVNRALLNAPERLVFNLVQGFHRHPEYACLVPALCRACGKGFTGTDTPGLLLCLDKWQTRAALLASGIPCPPGVLAPAEREVDMDRLFPGPFIVKPARADASEGIDNSSVVPGPGRALADAVRRVHAQSRQDAVIERFIDGRELNVSLLWRQGAPTVLPLAEIDFSAFDPGLPRIVSYEAKWLPDSYAYRHTPNVIPAPLAPELAEEIRDLTVRAVRVLGCDDYARVDFRLDTQGRPFVLEVNPNPDISPDGGYPAALAAAGIPFAEFVGMALHNALARLEENPGEQTGDATAAPDDFADAARAGSIIRWSRPEDRPAILQMLEETGFFRPDELAVGQEVLDDALVKGMAGHYQSYVAEKDGQAVGWVCFGPTPCTLGTFDVYWIVVSPRCQRMGIGKRLMEQVERAVIRRNGRQLVVETSSRSVYDPTRAFYANAGYRQIARLADFYTPGDDMVVFAKSMC